MRAVSKAYSDAECPRTGHYIDYQQAEIDYRHAEFLSVWVRLSQVNLTKLMGELTRQRWRDRTLNRTFISQLVTLPLLFLC